MLNRSGTHELFRVQNSTCDCQLPSQARLSTLNWTTNLALVKPERIPGNGSRSLHQKAPKTKLLFLPMGTNLVTFYAELLCIFSNFKEKICSSWVVDAIMSIYRKILFSLAIESAYLPSSGARRTAYVALITPYKINNLIFYKGLSVIFIVINSLIM
jgi:hypothetical protein